MDRLKMCTGICCGCLFLLCTSFYGGSTPVFWWDELCTWPFSIPLPLTTHWLKSPHSVFEGWPCWCMLYFQESKQWHGCQCLGFLTCTQMLMHVTTHGGYVNTVRESALKADWGRKNPCDIRELNLYQYCAMLFGLTLYQLSCPAPVHCYWFEPC